jgi:hypothetical protein
MTTDLALPDPKVQVISPTGKRPGIVNKMVPIAVDLDVAEAEVARYTDLNVKGRELGTQAAYEALLDGRVMINLHDTLKKGIQQATVDGIGNIGVPKFTIAAARPWDHVVYSRCHSTGMAELYTRIWGNGAPRGEPMYAFGSGRGRSIDTHRAVVPTLPPDVRQKFPQALKDRTGHWMVLWEPSWEVVSTRRPRPPRNWDPALLEQVEGSVYVVRAVWDLSPVEVAALLPGPRF